jgi:hypothetical protein
MSRKALRKWAADIPVDRVSERAVLMLLAHFATERNEVWLPISQIAQRACLSKAETRACLLKLKKLGLITPIKPPPENIQEIKSVTNFRWPLLQRYGTELRSIEVVACMLHPLVSSQCQGWSSM